MLCYVVLCYAAINNFCHAMLCYAMQAGALCYVMLCYMVLCYTLLCYVMLYHPLFYHSPLHVTQMLCYAMLCCALSCYVVLCNVMLRYREVAQYYRYVIITLLFFILEFGIWKMTLKIFRLCYVHFWSMATFVLRFECVTLRKSWMDSNVYILHTCMDEPYGHNIAFESMYTALQHVNIRPHYS